MGNKEKRNLLIISRVLLIIIGSILLAFGTAAFLTPFDIVSGGLSGIGILVDKGFQNIGVTINTIDITVWVLDILFLILSFIFLGKKFTLSTLISTIAYPAFLTIFMRCGVSTFFFNALQDLRPSSIIIAAVVGGLLNGLGLAITFIGGGSTGGLDVLCFILNKYFKIKISISTFALDFVIILTGILVLGLGGYKYGLYACLCGILTAIVSAVVIKFVYTETNTIYIADIVSEKEEEISKFTHEKLERTTTVMKGKGTYLGKEVDVIRFVFEKRELNELKEAISNIDPKAFMTIYTGRTVYGEGFTVLKPFLLDSFVLKRFKKEEKEQNEDKKS